MTTQTSFFLLLPAHLPLFLCRCAKEWKLAVHMTKDCRQCQLVVAAAARCSRPEVLKPFLYLDFMDQRKHHTVWDILMQTVGELGVQGLTSSTNSVIPRLLPCSGYKATVSEGQATHARRSQSETVACLHA